MTATRPTLLVLHPARREPEHAYTIDLVLGRRLGLACQRRAEDREDVEISLAEDPQGPRVSIDDVLLARTSESEWLAPGSLPVAPLEGWRVADDIPEVALTSPRLPVLLGAPTLATTPRGATLGLDVFGAVFFLLTRYEEIACPRRDEHGRFASAASLASRAGFLDRPLADEYVELLWAVLRRAWPRLERRADGPKLRLSCDVDWPHYELHGLRDAMRAAVGDIARRRDRELAAVRLRAWRAQTRGGPGSNPWDSFDFIMDQAERRGLRAAFYFMAGCTDPARDGCYSLDDPRIRALLRRIDARGHEIGLHPSYETYRDAEATRTESGALHRACGEEGIEPGRGGRQHFLRWENPGTWRNWEDAGLGYDSTLGYSDAIGFRAGTCVEYPVFDLRARRPLRLRERPLVVMEQALLGDSRRDDHEVVAPIRELRRRAELVGGDLTLLWHNSQLATPRLRRLFAAALDPG